MVNRVLPGVVLALSDVCLGLQSRATILAAEDENQKYGLLTWRPQIVLNSQRRALYSVCSRGTRIYNLRACGTKAFK